MMLARLLVRLTCLIAVGVVLSIAVGCKAQRFVTLEYVTPQGTVKDGVASDTRRLFVYQTEATSIVGLSQLGRLEEVVFEIPIRLSDFSFLNENQHIRVLHFMDCSFSSLDFLYGQSGLRDLVFQGCDLSPDGIDLSLLPSLEYLEITNSQLRELPIRASDPSRLHKMKGLNVAYNQLTSIGPALQEVLRFFGFVVVAGNPLPVVPAGYLTGDLTEVLPSEYHRFIR